MALSAAKIIGAVRLCFEQGHFVLRTMQIHPDFQKKGIGQKLLYEFDHLLQKKKIQSIFCMPFTHLEKFYGTIGFRKIQTSEAPLFLQQRLSDMLNREPGHHGILMLKG